MPDSADERNEISDKAVLLVMAQAIRRASSLVGIKPRSAPRLFWHDGPLAITQHDQAGIKVLLVRGSTRFQVMRQAGHEAVHVLAGTNESSWAYEMVAELTSLEFIKYRREFNYLALSRAELQRQAGAGGSLFDRPYNFGKCYRTGLALVAAMSRPHLLALVRYAPSDDGLAEWLASLPPEEAARAQDVISIEARS